MENLARTGTEYPLTKQTVQFIREHPAEEPLSEKQCKPELVEEYILNDSERANSNIGTTVFDSVDPSPHYDASAGDYYIDERELIELTFKPADGQINEPYQKRYNFSPLNLPYSFEQPHSYSARQGPAAPHNSNSNSVMERKGPRINRYYENLPPYYKLKGSSDNTLIFESRFESGNLRRAVKINDFEYDLFLKNDYGTQGYTQWFYFRVQNTRKDKTYRFNIVNLMKPDSNYNQGMKPLIYSVKEAETKKIGWKRDGFNIAYYQSSRKKKNGPIPNVTSASISSASTASSNYGNLKPDGGYGPLYYALTFEIKFAHDNDTVFFAHCYPYTYTDLCDFIKAQCVFNNKDKIRKTVLCKSLAGNDVDMLIITNFNSDPVDISFRKSIILTARVHPGESNASWMMNGVIEFLVGDDENAVYLRNTFVFKIIPMQNPDGVIVGNYRCSLMGVDLNRQWVGCSAKLYPINYHTKLMMKKTLESREILFYCDMHGHSIGRNAFMFGNNQPKPADRNKEKIFPL